MKLSINHPNFCPNDKNKALTTRIKNETSFRTLSHFKRAIKQKITATGSLFVFFEKNSHIK